MANSGLSSLNYGGVNYLSYGDFRLDQLTFVTPGGQTISGDLSGSVVVDPVQQTVTRQFSWGSIVTRYVTAANRLNTSVTVNNTSPNTISSIWFEPFGLHFPSAVQEYDGSIPLIVNTLGGPALQTTTYNSGVVVLAAEDVTKPLQLGYPWAFDKPSNTTFPLTFNTGKVSSYPDSYPDIVRPIAPGGSDTISFSLRFGPPGSTVQSLAGDVYQKFAAAYPATLQWPDRRAIGALFLSTAATGWPTNPRGWMIDPSVDVTTPAGIADLNSRVLAYADTSIGILKNMNAQGMVTWDIEGQQYPHATSYVCDPTQFDTLAPEMAGIADAYFQKFTAAGLKVGVCLRPQQFVQSADKSTAQQIAVADPDQMFQILLKKAKYAHDRWGATLFYVDSNVNPNDPNPIDISIFQRLVAALPDSLFMPEHSNLLYYAYTAPYKELRQGVTSTSSDVRLVYPNAFTVMYTADGPIAQNTNALVAAVKAGDVLLFRGWFDDPQNSLDASIYQQAGSVALPTVSITSPGNGSTVSGTVSITTVASGGNSISSVQISVDGSKFGPPLTAAPYQTALDTTKMTNGSHTILAIATDTAGNSASATASINVSNTSAAPTVSFSAPANGASVSGTVTLLATATGGSPIVNVGFAVDGLALTSVTSAPYQASLNTTNLTNGTHSLKATVTDNAGRTANATVNVTVSNLGAAPSVSITSPAKGATVKGAITVTASASSGAAITNVQYFVDGSAFATASTSPYSVSLNTSSLTNGSHTITATAVDSANRSATASVAVTVSNTTSTGCPAPATNAFTGCYYTYRNFETFKFSRVDPAINFNWPWQPSGIAPGVGPEDFSVRWQGNFTLSAGTYIFTLTTDDGSRLYIDNKLVLDGWYEHSPIPLTVTVPLQGSSHLIRVDYFQMSGSAAAQLTWSKQ